MEEVKIVQFLKYTIQFLHFRLVESMSMGSVFYT